MEIRINNTTYGIKIALEDLQSWDKRKLSIGGLSKHFENRVKDGYMPFINPNKSRGITLEEALHSLTKAVLRTIKRHLKNEPRPSNSPDK